MYRYGMDAETGMPGIRDVTPSRGAARTAQPEADGQCTAGTSLHSAVRMTFYQNAPPNADRHRRFRPIGRYCGVTR